VTGSERKQTCSLQIVIVNKTPSITYPIFKLAQNDIEVIQIDDSQPGRQNERKLSETLALRLNPGGSKASNNVLQQAKHRNIFSFLLQTSEFRKERKKKTDLKMKAK
jgi:regulator of sirC expression with transglutaminase-like and TPR domain